MNILQETQLDRDRELAFLLQMPLAEVQKLGIATPESIRISTGEQPENLEDLYHDYEHLNFPAYLRTLMKTSATRRHAELFKLLKETKNKWCLDFGSGVGTHSIALFENNNQVDLLDVPGKLQIFAKKRILNRKWSGAFNIISNDYNLMDNTYDIVICHDCLEHCKYPIKELKRIHASLKVSGVLSILVSTMLKPSSGHFSSSINKWKKFGNDYLNTYFEKINNVTYRKIK